MPFVRYSVHHRSIVQWSVWTGGESQWCLGLPQPNLLTGKLFREYSFMNFSQIVPSVAGAVHFIRFMFQISADPWPRPRSWAALGTNYRDLPSPHRYRAVKQPEQSGPRARELIRYPSRQWTWTGRATLACAGYLLLLLLVLLGNEEVKTLNLDDLIDLKIVSASQTSPLLHAGQSTLPTEYYYVWPLPRAWPGSQQSPATTLRTRAKITRGRAVIGQHVIDSSK